MTSNPADTPFRDRFEIFMDTQRTLKEWKEHTLVVNGVPDENLDEAFLKPWLEAVTKSSEDSSADLIALKSAIGGHCSSDCGGFASFSGSAMWVKLVSFLC
jgi:hypothetical protein